MTAADELLHFLVSAFPETAMGLTASRMTHHLHTKRYNRPLCAEQRHFTPRNVNALDTHRKGW